MQNRKLVHHEMVQKELWPKKRVEKEIRVERFRKACLKVGENWQKSKLRIGCAFQIWGTAA